MATITPTHNLHPEDSRGAWEYAVPLAGDENKISGYPSYENTSLQSRSSRSPLTHQTNGNSLRSRASESALGSATADSTELHKSSSRPTKKLRKQKSSNATNTVKMTEENESKWIHRDKLAQIESKEMEEFGLRLGRRVSDRQSTGNDSDKRQRLASPIRLDDTIEDQEHIDENENLSSSSPTYPSKTGGFKSPNSRIPLPRNASGSGASETPLNGSRSRAGSEGMSYSPEQSPVYARPVRHIGQEDDYDMMNSSPDSARRDVSNNPSNGSDKSSPKKSTHRNARNPGVRTASQQKHRNLSSTTTVKSNEMKRPGTSSGNAANGRPSTSHRTDGEPPWLATMYKPDPRLPPDQQMLPTHAKRLAQEQWQREGKSGTVYDREFNPLNDQPFPDNPMFLDDAHDHKPIQLPGPQPSPNLTAPDDLPNGLVPPTSPRDGTSSPRPGTSDTHAGYRTTPRISKSPTPTSPQLGYNKSSHGLDLDNIEAPPSVAPLRILDFDRLEEEAREDRKKAGCLACCVVM